MQNLMNPAVFFKHCQRLLALVCFSLILSVPALASGGGGPSGPEPLKFTVNLQNESGENKYLQLEFVFETAKPEAQAPLVTYRPRIQHAVILLLSGLKAENLRSRQGKHHLAVDIIEVVNKIIDETEKTGVNEVLFTNFIIQ